MSSVPQALASAEDPARFIGFMGLMRMELAGVDLYKVGPQLEARVRRNPADANALLDLSTLMFLLMEPAQREMAFSLQARALALQQVYRLPAAGPRPAMRLLAIYGPGDMTANTPLDCLLEGSDVETTLLYVTPERPLPYGLPEHDLVYVAMGESDRSLPLLGGLDSLAQLSGKAIVNPPSRIALLGRDTVAARLDGVAGLQMPATLRAPRGSLEEVAANRRAVASLLPGANFPLIIRPVGSHGGKDLERLEDAPSLARYLATAPDAEFYISPFIDYRSRDGMYRKVRVALIEGRPYACHLAISQNWMVHYANAGMFDSAEKRAEEELFFREFEQVFVRRHEAALREINEALGLDYVGIDCGETPEGELLVFEADTAMIVHAVDPVEVFPYKPAQMRKVFDAFRALLSHAAERVVPSA